MGKERGGGEKGTRSREEERKLEPRKALDRSEKREARHSDLGSSFTHTPPTSCLSGFLPFSSS